MSDMRALVEAMQAGTPEPGVRFRQGVIVSVQGSTCTVTISGSTTSVAGIHYAAHVCPVPGATCWLSTDGRDWFIIATLAPSGPAWATMTKSTQQSIPNSSLTALTWNSRSGVASYGVTIGNAGFTVVVPGLYSLSASPAFVANSTGVRVSQFTKDTIAIWQGQTAPGNGTAVTRIALAAVVKLAVGDVINVEVWQNSGGNLNTDTGGGTCSMSMSWIGPA